MNLADTRKPYPGARVMFRSMNGGDYVADVCEVWATTVTLSVNRMSGRGMCSHETMYSVPFAQNTEDTDCWYWPEDPNSK